MPDIHFDLNGIVKLLLNLKPDKAAGPDQLKPLVLKHLGSIIGPAIQLIFRKSYLSGQLPSEWKTASVTPLFKKGDKSDPANYRPISLTCILCKVMEHIITSIKSKAL